jgi:hypothetical protein
MGGAIQRWNIATLEYLKFVELFLYCFNSFTNSEASNYFNARELRYRVDTKWRFQFFAKYDYRFLLDVIIAIIAIFIAQAIIAISRLSLSISRERLLLLRNRS